MNPDILDSKVQDFINEHLKSDVSALILKGIPFSEITAVDVVEQIEAKNKCEKKLPSWFQQSNIYFPNKLNIEQTSSELTAAYKSKLINGTSLIDLTGGFGVDSFYFAKIFQHVVHCEMNPVLSQIASHNFKVLKADNIDTVAKDGLFFLQNSLENFDWIYVDPSRRHESKGKVFFLKDCLPNIPQHLDLLWSRSKNMLIKTSPLLDITIGINELEYIKAIHIVAVNNEVKELLWILEHGFSGPITIKTINLKSRSSERFEFLIADESLIEPSYSEPLTYLYEPNSAVLKSGGFNVLIKAFNVYKLHKHSHLYTSEMLIEFPGRRFKIIDSLPYNKKQLKKLGLNKANITIRNFPESVENIRKSFKIKDGGDQYLFFTTDHKNQKIVLICTKIQ